MKTLTVLEIKEIIEKRIKYISDWDMDDTNHSYISGMIYGLNQALADLLAEEKD